MTHHRRWHKFTRKYNANGTEVSKHYYQKETEHECDAMDGKLTTFSYVMYNGVCPLCGYEVAEVE